MKWFRLSLRPSSYHSHLNHPEIWYNSPREIQRSQPKRCEKKSRGSTEFWRDRYEGLSSYNSPSIDLYMISTCCSTKIDFLCLPSSIWQTIHGNKICMISRFEMATCWKEISLQWMKIRKKKHGNPTIFSRLIVTQASESHHGFRALVDSYDTVDEIVHQWLKPKQNNGVNRLSTGAGFLLQCIMVVCPSSFMGFCGYTGYVLELLTMLSLGFFPICRNWWWHIDSFKHLPSSQNTETDKKWKGENDQSSMLAGAPLVMLLAL